MPEIDGAAVSRRRRQRQHRRRCGGGRRGRVRSDRRRRGVVRALVNLDGLPDFARRREGSLPPVGPLVQVVAVVQTSHWSVSVNVSPDGPGVPALTVRVCPSCAVPEMVGAVRVVALATPTKHRPADNRRQHTNPRSRQPRRTSKNLFMNPVCICPDTPAARLHRLMTVTISRPGARTAARRCLRTFSLNSAARRRAALSKNFFTQRAVTRPFLTRWIVVTRRSPANGLPRPSCVHD